MKNERLIFVLLLMITACVLGMTGCTPRTQAETQSATESGTAAAETAETVTPSEEPAGLNSGVQTQSEAPLPPPPQKPIAASDVKNEGAAAPGDAIYFIIVDRFFNAQNNTEDVDLNDPAGWHGGDLEGIRLKLPWLQSMGITKLWLSPVYTAASEKFFGNGAFHGYWTYDLNTIDKHFGSEEDLKKLAEDAKGYGIEIILDFVVNHVGYGAKLVEEKPDWFHPAKTIEDWNDPEQLLNRQVHGLPDLDQSNPEVYAYIMNAAWKWISLPNIAGFRLDAVKHVDIKFWSDFNNQLKSGKKNIMLLGEYFDGNPAHVDEIQKNGKFTQMFDFPFSFAVRDIFCENKSLASLASIVNNDRLYSSANDMVTFLDNHDMPRFITLCHDDHEAMGRALRVMLAWRGIPSIYFGTESALPGAKEPENRADMNFDSAEFYPLIQSTLRLRAQNPVFAKGETSVLVYQPGLVVFAREYKNQQALIAISQGTMSQSFRLPAGNWRDAESSRRVNNVATVKANSVQIFIQNDATTPLIDKSMRSVTFRVPQDGATYAIVGSAPELGQWNPANAPKTTSEITIEFPAQTVISYKPVRVSDSGEITWAEGANRELFTNTTSSVDVKW